MQKSESIFSRACSEISQNLLTVTAPNKKEVKREIKKICVKYSLERIPRNYEILSTVSGSDYNKLQKVLLRKPVKTASGKELLQRDELLRKGHHEIDEYLLKGQHEGQQFVSLQQFFSSLRLVFLK